jgi:methyltransferase (TIGR00027 family)
MESIMKKEKPSTTARKVALNIITLGAIPEMDKVLPPGTVDATAELLVASGVVKPTLVRWSRSPKMVSVYQAFDWMMPGQFEAFGHRKAFCEQQVRKGIGIGVSQVLMLGAGYDTLGWRLAQEFTGVNFFEIDHPATAHLKSIGIKSMGQQDNIHLIVEDLGKQKLVDVLKDNESWDPSAKTVIIAEGLLMYLQQDAVRDLFNQCSTISGAGSRVVFTYIGTSVDGRPDAGPWKGLVLWILKVFGEPWRWSISPHELTHFLEVTGWINSPELNGAKDKYGIEFFAVARK